MFGRNAAYASAPLISIRVRPKIADAIFLIGPFSKHYAPANPFFFNIGVTVGARPRNAR